MAGSQARVGGHLLYVHGAASQEQGEKHKDGVGHSSWYADEEPDQKVNEGPRASQQINIRHAPPEHSTFLSLLPGGRIFLQRGSGG